MYNSHPQDLRKLSGGCTHTLVCVWHTHSPAPWGGSMSLFPAIPQGLFTGSHLELLLLPTTLGKIFRLFEGAHSPSEACLVYTSILGSVLGNSGVTLHAGFQGDHVRKVTFTTRVLVYLLLYRLRVVKAPLLLLDLFLYCFLKLRKNFSIRGAPHDKIW